MTGYHRKIPTPLSKDRMDVTMTDCGRCHLHLDLTGLRWIDL